MIDLDTLKMVLRGLIVSNPRAMTIETLSRDYRTSEGHELPFMQMGFRSAGDLLTTLEDTVRIRGNMVYVVSSEETAHLESLIARQRKGRKKGRPSSGFHRKPTTYKQNLPLKFQNSSSNYSSGKNSSYSTYPSTSGQSHNRTSSSVAYSSYRREDDRNFQTEEVRSRSWGENRKSAHFYEDELEYDLEDEYDAFEAVPPSNGNNIKDYSREVEDRAFSLVQDSLFGKVNNDVVDISVGLASSFLDVDSVSSPSCNGTRATVKDYLDSDDDNSVSPRMQKNLKEIIQAYPSGLRCARLPEEYLRRFGVPLDCRQCGYVSVNQMAMALPEVFRCVRINSGDWMLFDASQPPPEQFLHISNDDEFVPQVSGKVLERISSILSTKCRGVNLNDFAVNYMLLYGSLLTDDVENLESMEDLFKSLNKSKVVIVREVKGEMMVYPPSGEGNVLNNDALPVELTWEEIRSTLPPTAIKPEDKCPKITLPKILEFGHYIIVRLGEIYNPWKFWIHIYSRDHSAKLDELMDHMQIFYSNNKRRYFAPISQWKRGQHCVALYDNEWHRAEILSIVDDNHVKLKYFDYGTIDVVKKTDLRLLDQQFLNLPMMAIKAKLSAIKPAKRQKVWSRAANEFFFSLVVKKRLVASVVKILRDRPFLSVALVNTEDGEDVHINDLLVENGFAEWSTSDSDSEWTDDPVEPDYAEVVEGVEKWESEVNKSNPSASTPKTASREGVHKGSPPASTVRDTNKTSKPSVKKISLSSDLPASTADIISSCLEVLLFSPAPAQAVPSALNTVPPPVLTSASPAPTSASPAPTSASPAPTSAFPAPTSAPPASTSAPPTSTSASPAPKLAPPGLSAAPPQTVPSAHPSPNFSYPPRSCRPPPGFSAISPVKAPPGLALQGPNMCYVNNDVPSNADRSNVTPQVPPNVMFPNMVNPVAFNCMPYDQMSLNAGLQYRHFNGQNPMVAQQMMPTLHQMQQWPMNVPNPWNTQYSNYNQSMVRPPLANNNAVFQPPLANNYPVFRPPLANNYPVFRPQYTLKQNQSYPNQSYQMKPANIVPFGNNNVYYNVPNQAEEKVAAPSNTKTRSSAETTYLPSLENVASAMESTPSLAQKMTRERPSPPPGLTPPPPGLPPHPPGLTPPPPGLTPPPPGLTPPPPGLTPPPPGLTPPPPPVDEPAEEIEGAEEEISLSAEVAPKSSGEETSVCENSKMHEDDCQENESMLMMVPSRSSSPDLQLGSHPVNEEGVEALEDVLGTQLNKMKSTEDECNPVTPRRRLWKPLDVGVGVVHLLNLNGEAHVTSDELARVCLKMEGHEDLVKALASKSVTDVVFECTRGGNEEFFSSLASCPGLKEIIHSEGKFPQSSLHLIPLTKVVNALIAAGVKRPRIVFAFQIARADIVEKDDFWQEDSQDSTVQCSKN